MKILPDLRLIVDDVHITLRQTQALNAIAKTKSQNQAARILGISVPVLHRYIKDMEQKLGEKLILTTTQGTLLTEFGREMVDAHKKFEKRLMALDRPIVACSPLYSHLVLQSISTVERMDYQIDMFIGNDELNNRLLEMGLVDFIIFDDPVYIYREKETYERHDFVEIVKDTLIHVDRGRKYLRYGYGAQRIGFSNLDLAGIDYEIVGETKDWQQLLKSDYSFFINRSLVKREELKLKSKTDPKLLMHSILALKVREKEGLDALLQLLGDLHKK